jgi:catalase
MTALQPHRQSFGGARLALEAAAVNFLRDAFGHLKVIGYLPAAAPLFVKGGVNDAAPDTDAGLIAFPRPTVKDFVTAASTGRIWAREPMVRPSITSLACLHQE